MKDTTLCFLVNKDKICLAMKKRGFGEGKWNGVGGKVHEGETIEEAAVREMKEEIGVDTEVRELQSVGSIKFLFNEYPDWNQHMHIFFIEKWRREPRESEEMRPEWHDKNKLPYERMWVDDPHWLPLVLSGKKVEGEFYFKGQGSEIDKFKVREI